MNATIRTDSGRQIQIDNVVEGALQVGDGRFFLGIGLDGASLLIQQPNSQYIRTYTHKELLERLLCEHPTT